LYSSDILLSYRRSPTVTDFSTKTLKSKLGDTAETSINVDVGFQTPTSSDAESDSLPVGASASDINRSTLSVLGVGPDNITQLQSVPSTQMTHDFGRFRAQLFQGHQSQMRIAQDSSMFRPILPESSRYRRVPRQMGLVESRPSSHDQLSSLELRRPLSPDLSDGSDSESELNRLPQRQLSLSRSCLVSRRLLHMHRTLPACHAYLVVYRQAVTVIVRLLLQLLRLFSLHIS